MAESVVAVTEGSGKNFHTNSKSIGGTTKEDQFVIPGEHPIATYTALAAGISTATSASHLITIEADGTNYIRIHRLWIQQVAAAGSATLAQLAWFRTTTASSGGSSITARPLDSTDSAFGGVIRTIPTKGTEGVQLYQWRMGLSNSAPAAANPNVMEWTARTDQKPVIVGPATTDGLALKIITGIASGTVDITIEFTVTSYL